MSILTEWVNRLRYLRDRDRFERDLDEEVQFHVETRADELQAAGMPLPEALAKARREFGSPALVKEESRGAWRLRWLHDLVTDLRHSVRLCLRSPAFTLTAVLSLALGIGGTSAIYTALDAVLWRPLPVEEPDRLVTFSILRDKGAPEPDVPWAFVRQLRKAGVFSGVTLNTGDGLSFAYDGRAERIISETVSPDFFEVLGVQPMLGQGFTAGVRSGQWAPEAVLSYRFWQRRFGEDPGIIGQTIRLNTYPFTIVGITPPSFYGLTRGTDYELRIPFLPEGREMAQIRQISGKQVWVSAVARLKPGATMAQAEAAVDAQFQEFLRTTTLPRFRNAGLRRMRVLPMARGYDEVVVSLRTPLIALLILVAVVLLIACSNVAGMLLARGAARAREFAIRTSIGAGRFRLIRQMLAESILLSIVGGALGLAVAYWAADVLFRFLPQGHIQIAVDLHPDRRALLFAFGLSLLTGVLFGLAPALQAVRGSLAGVLRGGSAGSGGSPLRKVIVASQVALSLALLVAAGVFVRTVSRLRPADYREPERILLFTMKPQQEIYSDDRKRELARELVRRVSALPGVENAALAEAGPLGSRASSQTVAVPGHDTIRAGNDSVTTGFFDTLGIRRIAGRDFNPGDRPGSAPVVIVNQALARVLFPMQDPIGRTVTIPVGKQDGSYQIVGVVGDGHYNDVHRSAQPFLWFAMSQEAPYMPTLHVRTRTSHTAGMSAAIRHEFDAMDKGFPVFNVRTMAARIEDSLAGERMLASLAGAFGMLALALAGVGLYGILAYSVSRRTREIGIRMALGARTGSVLWMIVRESFVLVAAGSAAGSVLAIAAFRVVSQYLGDVSPVNAATVAACVFGMLMVTAVATVFPAFRGCRVDPLGALRQD